MDERKMIINQQSETLAMNTVLTCSQAEWAVAQLYDTYGGGKRFYALLKVLKGWSDKLSVSQMMLLIVTIIYDGTVIE